MANITNQYSNDYNAFLVEIKQQIKSSQIKAIKSVNQEMIMLYFSIGKSIYQKQQELGWGAKVIDKLSHDIKSEFPELGGFSTRNMKLMVQFYREYATVEIVQPSVAQSEHEQNGQQLVAQIPWAHNIILIQKIKDRELRYWYIQKILEHGWSRNILSLMISSEVHKRDGKLVSNFKDILSSYESDLVQQSFKDPYLFDFLTIEKPFRERELELNLIKHMEKFLIELGSGFAFVGRQYKLEVAHKEDKSTIGLILCQEKNQIVAEYLLKNMSQPIGISEYELTEVLPKEFESSLPTIEMIENELRDSLDEKNQTVEDFGR